MKQYLIRTFHYNSFANKKLIEKVGQLPDKTECINLISHLINCMYKWLARTKEETGSHEISWWDSHIIMRNLNPKGQIPWKIGIDSLNELINHGLTVKHRRFE